MAFVTSQKVSQPMSPKVEKAEIQDIELLNQISIASKMYWDYPQEWLEYWKDSLSLKEEDFSIQSIYKLVENATILGFCPIKETKEAYEIYHLWIKPDCIGKSYGKFLLNESLQRIVSQAKPILVEADPNAEAFYQRQGFLTFSQVESYPSGRYLPLMKKEIIW